MKMYQQSKARFDSCFIKFDKSELLWLVYDYKNNPQSWSGSGHGIGLKKDGTLWYYDLGWSSWGPYDETDRQITLYEYENNKNVTDMEFSEKVLRKIKRLLENNGENKLG